MNEYIAWLNGNSVARGTLTQVEAKAREVFATPHFQEWGLKNGAAVLRITRGARQMFVKSIILGKGFERGISKNGFPL